MTQMPIDTLQVPETREQSLPRFDLGVDVLAARQAFDSLPVDWHPQGLGHRDHGSGHWVPENPAQLEIWAATLDVPGF